MHNNKEVAIKILKVDQPLMSNKLMLGRFLKEIELLSQCEHPNIVKLIDASFDGTIVKEALSVRKTSLDHSVMEHIETSCIQRMKRGEEDEEDQVILKRKTGVCYCVLKLARHGELFKFLENTEKFSD